MYKKRQWIRKIDYGRDAGFLSGTGYHQLWRSHRKVKLIAFSKKSFCISMFW